MGARDGKGGSSTRSDHRAGRDRHRIGDPTGYPTFVGARAGRRLRRNDADVVGRYLEAGIWAMTASATSRIPSRRSIAVFWIQRNASGSVSFELRHEHALGAVDGLAGLQPLAEVGDLGLERLAARPTATWRSRSPGTRSAWRERLDDVGHHAGVPGPLDELASG